MVCFKWKHYLGTQIYCHTSSTMYRQCLVWVDCMSNGKSFKRNVMLSNILICLHYQLVFDYNSLIHENWSMRRRDRWRQSEHQIIKLRFLPLEWSHQWLPWRDILPQSKSYETSNMLRSFPTLTSPMHQSSIHPLSESIWLAFKDLAVPQFVSFSKKVFKLLPAFRGIFCQDISSNFLASKVLHIPGKWPACYFWWSSSHGDCWLMISSYF